jgi:antitoxin component of MazEF toxin-antitoxin module
MDSNYNPRKITQSGGMMVVSLPKDLLDSLDLEKGNRVAIEERGNGFYVEKVEWKRAGGSD